MIKKKTKLKDLKITKVDVVPAGCNPDADVVITKGAESFAESFEETIENKSKEKIRGQIWDYGTALTSSLISILDDDDTADKAPAMRTSIDEFYGAIGFAVEDWAKGQTTEYITASEPDEKTTEIVKGLATAFCNDGETQETEEEKINENNIIQKGVNEDMKIEDIDRSVLNEEELGQLDAIIAKAKKPVPDDDPEKKGDAGETNTGKEPGDEGNTPEKSDPENEEKKKNVKKGIEPEDESSDIYKGVNPLVRKELEAMRSFIDAAEERDLTEVAKGYAILGKTPEELVPVMKQLKADGGTAYNDYIATLDAAREAVEKSGMYAEIGRNGHGASTITKSKSESRIDAKAEEIKKAHPELTKEQAVLRAVNENPELYAEYQKEVF